MEISQVLGNLHKEFINVLVKDGAVVTKAEVVKTIKV